MNDTPVTFPIKFTPEQLASISQGTLHPEAIVGMRLYNQGLYFEAHEALETAWRAEPGLIRELYRGILQVGVGYLKIQRGSYVGALKFFLSCRKWLDPFPDTCRGINVKKLRLDFKHVEAELIRLGPDKIASFDQSLFQPVEFTT